MGLQFDRFNDRAESLPLPRVDFRKVEDGTYVGSHAMEPFVSVELEVSIQDGRVVAIDLIDHDNGRGQAAEAILSRVIEQNELPVDVVSGATASSKALMYAVADAVEGTTGE